MSKKKTHRIFARDRDAMMDGLKTSRGNVDFKGQTAVYVDEYTAKEVDERYGIKSQEQSVIVSKDEQYDRAVNGEGWKIQYDKRGDWVKTLHNYTFTGVDMTQRGGNERVKVKTADGYTFMSQDAAEELGLEIIPQKRSERRKGAEVQVHGEYSGERST